MKILIIGGTGFIGSVVVRQLAAMQHQVTVFHRRQTSAELSASVNHILGDRHSLLNYRLWEREVGMLDPTPLVD